jgi:hypothetical protein
MLRFISMARLLALLMVGGLAAPLGWFVASRFVTVVDRLDREPSDFGEPAASLLARPALAALPGLLVILLALLGLLLPRLRWAALLLSTAALLGLVVVLLLLTVSVLGPLYSLEP